MPAGSPAFTLPDTIAALPVRPFEFSPTAWEEAARIAAGEPAGLFRQLLREQESETTLLAARRVLDGFFRAEAGSAPVDRLAEDADAGAIAAHLAAVRAELAAAVQPLT